MIAVIPVRDGVLPAGAIEAIAECDGHALLAGSATVAVDVESIARDVLLLELGDVEPARWATALGAVLGSIDDAGQVDASLVDAIVLPSSPDGRDLAPRLAHVLDRPLYAGATEIGDGIVKVARAGGRALHEYRVTGPCIVTLQPGIRGAEPFAGTPTITTLDPPQDERVTHDARVVDVLPPDVRTMDLAEATRIVGGGAGLDAEQRFGQLDEFATAIGASMGATRVITDRSWVHHDKQIGTTGVVVDPALYVSFGVSGAVQHTAGLGSPAHIVSVNTDPHCPMMAMSDLAIVSDANATLDELSALLADPSALWDDDRSAS